MRFVFSGFEQSVDILPGRVSVLEIENKTLFTRLCQALLSKQGENALEPFTLWDDERGELSPRSSYDVVVDPFDVKRWQKECSTVLFETMEGLLYENESVREQIEKLGLQLEGRAKALGFQLSSDYDFAVEWSMRNYLKAFGFGIAFEQNEPLLDNLNKCICMLSDVGYKKALVFVNLKQFFCAKDLEKLYEQIIFSGLSVLLLEGVLDDSVFEHERKMLIDQHFLETRI